MAVFTVDKSQNILDICLQLYGSTQYLFQLCRDNNLSIDGDVSIGDELYFDETQGELKILNKIKRTGVDMINPAAGQSTTIDIVTDGLGTPFTDGLGNIFTYL